MGAIPCGKVGKMTASLRKPDIQILESPSRILAVVRRRAALSEVPAVIPEACGEVWKFLRATALPHAGLNVVVYRHAHDQVFDLECGVEVLQAFEDTGAVVRSSTPAGLTATAAHFGPYSELLNTHAAIRTWCQAHGKVLAGVSWEVYGHWTDEPARLRTDVFYLLRDQVP